MEGLEWNCSKCQNNMIERIKRIRRIKEINLLDPINLTLRKISFKPFNHPDSEADKQAHKAPQNDHRNETLAKKLPDIA